ncbi:MAG TPA: hypothetical protein VN816_03235 [Acidimicrobiales bacterium]|nr:hypothetical protein [Acidimicrobiales bacterium]
MRSLILGSPVVVVVAMRHLPSLWTPGLPGALVGSVTAARGVVLDGPP